MTIADVLADAFERVHGVVHRVVDGSTPEQLVARVNKANSIAWLVWHLTRIQDDHIADAAGVQQVWTSKGWADRWGLPFAPRETGYGMSFEQVSVIRTAGELVTGYFDAVHEQTLRYVKTLQDADLNRIVDEAWDPPVTLGTRLVSVISDDLQHAGQAALLRGLLSR